MMNTGFKIMHVINFVSKTKRYIRINTVVNCSVLFLDQWHIECKDPYYTEYLCNERTNESPIPGQQLLILSQDNGTTIIILSQQLLILLQDKETVI